MSDSITNTSTPTALDQTAAKPDADECRRAFEHWCRQDGQTGDIATDPNGNYFDSTSAEWKAWQAAWNTRAPQPAKPVDEPTEAMCDKARWFVLARDVGTHTWGSLLKHGRPTTTPYIEHKIATDPKGHITKWDFAQCVYELMTKGTDHAG